MKSFDFSKKFTGRNQSEAKKKARYEEEFQDEFENAGGKPNQHKVKVRDFMEHRARMWQRDKANCGNKRNSEAGKAMLFINQ